MHTPEPWFMKYGDSNELFENQWPIIFSESYNIVGTEGMYGNLEIDIANARRIVACVNELAGKPEGYVKQLEQQRDELLAAIHNIGDCIEMADDGASNAGLPSNGSCRRHLEYARTIIAKAQGDV